MIPVERGDEGRGASAGNLAAKTGPAQKDAAANRGVT